MMMLVVVNQQWDFNSAATKLGLSFGRMFNVDLTSDVSNNIVVYT